MTIHPTGTGVYIRRLGESRHGTPKQAAKKAADHCLNFVAIMAAWQDYHQGKHRFLTFNQRNDRLTRYAEAFAREGIDVHIWAYPWGGGEEKLVDEMRVVTENAPISGWLFDPELGYKWVGKDDIRAGGTNMRGKQPEAIKGARPQGTEKQRTKQAEKLMQLGLEARNDLGFYGLGVTSYGVARFHKNFPWSAFLDHDDIWLSPQLYKATPDWVDRGIDDWLVRAGGSDPSAIVPSIGTYGPRSGAKMHNHLSSFVDSHTEVAGFIAWSWMQTNSQEWDVLARWADWLERGMCVEQGSGNTLSRKASERLAAS